MPGRLAKAASQPQPGNSRQSRMKPDAPGGETPLIVPDVETCLRGFAAEIGAERGGGVVAADIDEGEAFGPATTPVGPDLGGTERTGPVVIDGQCGGWGHGGRLCPSSSAPEREAVSGDNADTSETATPPMEAEVWPSFNVMTEEHPCFGTPPARQREAKALRAALPA